jgi:phosphatidylglycerol:prolipoprotein diacylglycerol transferase
MDLCSYQHWRMAFDSVMDVDSAIRECHLLGILNPIDPLILRLVYSLLLFTAVLVSFWLMNRRRHSVLPAFQMRYLGVAAFVGSMLGSKAPFLLERGWYGWFDGTIWFLDGKTILGGIFGGYVAVEIAKWALGIRAKTGDTFALPVAVAVCIGRLGCFVAGCCFGQPTTLPWGVAFPLANDPPNVLRHPNQLYEFLFHFVWVIVLWRMESKRIFDGHRLKLYLMTYLSFRFCTEWLRPESRLFMGLTAYQYACVVLFCMLGAQWIFDGRSSE